MTPDPHAPTPSTFAAARLRLDENAPHHGDLDGGWWPRSHVLAAELPGLVTALGPRLGRIAVVAYHPDDWDTAAETVEVDGDTIRTDNLSATPRAPHTVAVVAADGQCLTLVLVAPETTEARAHDALADSARPHRSRAEHQNDEISGAAAASTLRALDDVTHRLVRHTGAPTAQRTAAVAGWVRDAATQFEDAPIQTYVPILVENIVRNRIAVTRPAPGTSRRHRASARRRPPQ